MTSYCKIDYWMHNEHHYHQLFASGGKPSGHPVIISTCFARDAECQGERDASCPGCQKSKTTWKLSYVLWNLALPPAPFPCSFLSFGGPTCCSSLDTCFGEWLLSSAVRREGMAEGLPGWEGAVSAPVGALKGTWISGHSPGWGKGLPAMTWWTFPSIYTRYSLQSSSVLCGEEVICNSLARITLNENIQSTPNCDKLY